VDAEVEHTNRRHELIVIAVASAIYLGCILSPPGLMDDVDAVQAQIARNMLESGDWVTARLNGVAYLEKSPLVYWLMAGSYAVFGVHDWAARLPLALGVIALCWLVCRFGAWAFGGRAGLFAGLILATSVGLWLFTRIQIPDALLTATVALALWSFLRAFDDAETRPRMWAALGAAAMGTGLILKGLIAAVFPLAAMALWLAITGEWRRWRRLHPFSGALIVGLIAAPWHIAATLANPPYFDFTWRSVPGEYHGFFWFYFLNEHVFRFLNMRHPRDYNTVPRAAFWLFHLLWLFPWSGFFAALPRLEYRAPDRAARTRLLCLCFTGFLLVFFTFSTTQEYYSMPCYPALALLIAGAMERTRVGYRAAAVVSSLALAAVLFLLVQVWSLPSPGDISRALTQNPEAYTLSLGHMGDLTIASFAYLKLPLAVAACGFLAGVLAWRYRAAALVTMMVLFFHAARLALVAFDPYLGSRDLAEALRKAPSGQLIVDNQYYTFSSIFFYTNRGALLLNGRVNNLEYGSYAPGAPQVFLDDQRFAALWQSPERLYLAVEKPALDRIRSLAPSLHLVKESGGKFLFTNLPL
jgi:4-amino-4-deoxy-L-arabinose transferase-like glycosyltransferase